jgi:hypothetical protein
VASSVGSPRLAFVLTLALAVAGVPGVASAQGFFDFLQGLFGGFRPPLQQQIGPPLPNRSPSPEISEGPRKVDGTYAAYCVRLCDGRYFPLPAHAGAPSSSPQELCSAMCPAAKTDVYTGSGIDRGTSAKGKPYASLPNAFVYRDRLADDCSCTGQGATGLAKIDIQSDPTLRPGDIVSTKEGRAVFRGDSRPPHQTSEFVAAGDDKKVSAGSRRSGSEARAEETRAAPKRPAASAERAPVAPGQTPALGFVPERGHATPRVRFWD